MNDFHPGRGAFAPGVSASGAGGAVPRGLRPDAVQVLGKELRRDEARARRELAARAAAATVLWRRYGCPILSLEAPLRGQQDAGSAIVGHMLAEQGLPDRAVVTAEESRSTREELLAMRRRVRSHAWDRILIVTSCYHVARAQRICDDVLGRGVGRVLAPEAVLAGAAPDLADLIRAGTPRAATMKRELRMERRLSLLAYALRPFPRRVRFQIEVEAGALARGVDQRRRGLRPED